MSSRDRDKAAAGMLRRSLAHNSGAGAAGTEGDCPGPEILAAYFERSLNAEETALYELHFSQCARCREQLAMMARAGELAADATPQRWTWLWDWRVLAPVAAALLLVAVSISRRPSSPNLVAMSQPAELGTKELSQQAHAPAAGSSAANAPTVPIMPNSSLDKTQSAPSPQSATLPAGALSNNNEVAENRLDERRKEEQPEPPSNSIDAPRRDTGQHAVAKDSEPQTLSGALPSATSFPATAPAPAPPAPMPNAAGMPMNGAAAGAMAQAETDANADNLKTKQLAAPVKASRYAAEKKRSVGILIPTPDLQVLWRIRSAGFVEKSTDGGATWHGELPNPDAHLVAGSAPFAEICWVVGNSGMILLTRDGATWTKILPPAAADFIAVAAKDGVSATVTAADGRKYATADGGKHWNPAK